MPKELNSAAKEHWLAANQYKSATKEHWFATEEVKSVTNQHWFATGELKSVTDGHWLAADGFREDDGNKALMKVVPRFIIAHHQQSASPNHGEPGGGSRELGVAR
jgi:hypothetical protein